MENKKYIELLKDLPNKNVIYALLDPDTNEVRYVGKAVDLYTRIRNHYKPSRLINKTHKNNWLNKLLNEGKYVNVNVVEQLNSETLLNEAEKKWIKHYKTLACDLTNGTEGGDGGKMSLESIEKMKLKKAGVKLSEKHKQKISEANKGHIVTEETRNKLSEARKTYVVSDETRKKQSEAHKGKNTWSKGKTPSLETKEKMRMARLNYLAKSKNQ
jgi:hypothetical protein